MMAIDLPDNKQAMAVSMALAKLTGIGFTTSPAVPIDEFDKLAG
jgi:ribosomal protein S13